MQQVKGPKRPGKDLTESHFMRENRDFQDSLEGVQLSLKISSSSVYQVTYCNMRQEENDYRLPHAGELDPQTNSAMDRPLSPWVSLFIFSKPQLLPLKNTILIPTSRSQVRMRQEQE